jgi:prohibitin 2
MMKNSLLIGLIVIFSLSGCGEIIDTGNRGIETRFGKVEGQPLEEGFYFYNPLSTSIHELNVQTQKVAYEMETYTKDVQKSKFKLTINYAVDASKIGDIFLLYGDDYEDKLIPQVAEGALKNVIGKWEAVELIANRNKATDQIEVAIQAALKEKFINVSRVEINNIDFTDEFEKAVEAKVVAIQKAAESENRTKQIQEEAHQKVIAAKAEAESMKIRSEALSQNKSLVEYEAVQKWNGVLPQYVMSGTVPFINIK